MSLDQSKPQSSENRLGHEDNTVEIDCIVSEVEEFRVLIGQIHCIMKLAVSDFERQQNFKKLDLKWLSSAESTALDVWIMQVDFVNSISNLLQPDSFRGTTLWKHITFHAYRMGNGHIEPYEVLIDGVKIGLLYIQRNKTKIHSSEAWLRVTCLNIIRNKVDAIIREEKKIKEITLIQGCRFTGEPSLELEERLDYLDKALSTLSKEDQLIINQRFYEQKKYDEIQKYYSSELNAEVSIAALRKRESRALSRLREEFFKLYEIERNSTS